MKKLTILLGSCVLALTACATPVKGTVVEKEHIPGYTDTDTRAVYSNRCTGTGTSRKCSQVQTGTKQVTNTIPDKYYLIVDVEGDEDNKRDEVSRSTYDNYQIGDTYASEAKR